MIDAAFTLQRVTDGAREKKEMIRPTGLAFIHSVHTSSSKTRAEKSRAFCTLAAKSDVAFCLPNPCTLLLTSYLQKQMLLHSKFIKSL